MLKVYREIGRLIESGARGALATVIGSTGSTPGKESAKMLIREDGSTVGTIGGGCVEAEVCALARRVIEKEQPLRESFELTPRTAEEEGLACGGTMEVFVEPLGGPVVYTFGAGHIARSVVQLADIVGLNTVVIDDRSQFCDSRFFPSATELIVSEFEKCFEKLKITTNSYIVIVTRGHRYDRLVLSQAIQTPAAYIGMIGSRAKITRIFHALREEGVPPGQLAKVKAPIGLDIGARTPEEIAVSIVAQLIAHRRRAFLKGDHPERLPERPQEGTV
jgi:xanthine dehydrogenase accessory factor